MLKEDETPNWRLLVPCLADRAEGSLPAPLRSRWVWRWEMFLKGKIKLKPNIRRWSFTVDWQTHNPQRLTSKSQQEFPRRGTRPALLKYCRSFEKKLLIAHGVQQHTLPGFGSRITSSPCTEPLVLSGNRGMGRGVGTWCCSRRSCTAAVPSGGSTPGRSRPQLGTGGSSRTRCCRRRC